MGAHVAGGVTQLVVHQHPQGAVAVIHHPDAIGDAVEAVAIGAQFTGVEHLAECSPTFRSHQEGLGWEGRLAHLAGECERQGIGGAPQIHFVNMLEAVKGAVAIALHHQKNAAAGVVGDIANLVLAAAAAEQIEVLLHRGAVGRIDGEDAGQFRLAALGNAIGVAVHIQGALHKRIEQAIVGVEGHALDATICPAVAVDGRQAVDRFSTDYGAMLGLQQGLLAGGDIALN